MTAWNEIDLGHYWEMLELLPPAAQTGTGFLFGEPMRHDARDRPMFRAFVELHGRYFVSVDPITMADFRVIDPWEVASSLGGAS